MFGMSAFLLRVATVINSLPRNKSFICFDGFGGSRESWIEVVNHRLWFLAQSRSVIPSSGSISESVEKRVALLVENFLRALGRPPDLVSEHFATALLLELYSLLKLSNVYLVAGQAYDDRHAGVVYSFRFSWREGVYEPR